MPFSLKPQTDEEFLLSLFEHPQKQRPPLDPAFVSRAAEALSATGRLPPNAQPEEFVRDMFNPEKDFRGPKVGLLREAAEPCIAAAEKWLLSVPIGFLHTEELNGCAVLAPSGGKVILLDLGVLLHMHLLGRSILALTTWGAPQPFCRDHEPVAWVKTIIALAKHAIFMDDCHLENITTWHCPSLGEWDIESAKFAMNVELFVLLHEFGHIAQGHLDAANVVEKGPLKVFSTNHRQEFEADLFSYRRQAEAGKADAAALAAATLFRFFDLMEHLLHGKSRASNTHPAGRQRLSHIKDSGNLTSVGTEVVAEVESLFDKVIEVAPKL